MTGRQLAVLITLIAYKIVLIGIGILAERRTKSGADFLLGGRRLGPLVASISASASSSSAWTLLGVSGMAYASGLSAIWLFPGCVGGFCLNWYVLAPALQRLTHRSGALTATEVLAGEAGRPLHRAISVLGSLIILVALLTYVAYQFQGAGNSFAETFDMSDTTAVLLGSGIVIFYTLLGGFWAVSLTDTLQGLLMAATAIVLPVGALLHLGLGGFAEGLRAAGPDYTSLVGDRGLAAGVGFVAGLLGIGLGYPGQPHVVNRFMALENRAGAMRAARRLAVGWAVIVYTGMIVLGLCARVAFPDLVNKEKAFLAVANGLFHPVLAGVMVASVLSAVMSTADSQLLVAASTVHDLGLGGKSLLARSRVVVLLLSAGAVVTALTADKSIFDGVLFAWAAMGCAFGPLLLVTALRGPVSPTGTIVSMLCGFSLAVLAHRETPQSLAAWKGALERVVPFLVALTVAFACSQKRPAADSPNPA